MKRLKDSPAELQDLGLHAEDMALPVAPTADLLALRERTLARAALAHTAVAAVPVARVGWALKTALVSALSAAAGWAAHAAYLPVRDPLPPAPTAPVAAPPVHPPEAPVVMAAALPEAPTMQTAKAPVTTKVSEPVQAAQPPNLAQQLRVYESGRTALAAGNHAAAQQEFRRYLDAAPQGPLWVEASLGMLAALVARADWSAAEGQATLMLNDSRLGAKRMDVLKVRARARVALGQCALAEQDVGEAHASLEKRAEARARVRAECREAPRGTPPW